MLSALTTRFRGTSADAIPHEYPVLPDADPPEPPEGRDGDRSQDARDGFGKPSPEATPRPFVVEVAEGDEILFSQAFESGAFVIGASPQADIIIPDLVEPEVASVRLETVGSACLVTLTALAPGVDARGRELVEGRPVLFPERASFRVGGAYTFDIAFTPPKRPLVLERSSAPALLVVGGLALGGFAFVLGGADARAPADGLALGDARVPTEMPSAVATYADAPLRLASLPSPLDASVRLDGAQDALRSAFVTANLAPQLRVGASDGGLLIEGDVTPQERDRAVDVITAFRDRHDTEIELALVSDAREATFYDTVVLEPEPYLIASDGRRYGVDQRLPDGARIVSIDEAGVVLERDGLRQRVAFGL